MLLWTIFAAIQATGPAGPPPTLILLTQASDYVHDVVKRENGPSRVERTFHALAARSGRFRVDWTEDVTTLTPDRIRAARIIVFYTTGDLPIRADQYDAFEKWIEDGGLFLGIHCATDTLLKHPRYPKLIGARFVSHPWDGGATVTLKVHEPLWKACEPFAPEATIQEEIYMHADFDPDAVRVLISLDMEKTALKQPAHVPIAWCRTYGKGRIFYTSLGHRDEIWADARYQQHLLGAIEWLLGRDEQDATPNPQVSSREAEIARRAAR
jgi:type 1 glutamine amidotransferase